MSAVTYPRQAPRRGRVRPAAWWGRAWVRAVEEAAYSEVDLRAARSLTRQGAVGQVTVDLGSAVASVAERDDLWSVQVDCEQLPVEDRSLFIELVAAESGRVAGLLSGELTHELIEDGEEAGLELLPYAGDLGATCPCGSWVDPCRHALAVGYQVGWLLDRDPFVLLQLRGIEREALLADVHRLSSRPPDPADVGGSGCHRDQLPTLLEHDPDLAVGAEAADRARRALALIAEGKPFSHLF